MSTGTMDWAHLIFSTLAGVGVLLCGIGVLVISQAIAGAMRRLNHTLDEVDKSVAALAAPVAETLSHVGGIADTADSTIARLGAVVGTLETLAGGVGKTATMANESLAPAIENLGATMTGVTANLRRLVTGKRGNADNHSGGSHE